MIFLRMDFGLLFLWTASMTFVYSQEVVTSLTTIPTRVATKTQTVTSVEFSKTTRGKKDFTLYTM